ncbi:hypothetical protein CKF96_02370 [Priestia filamentosa]|nr:hypothetical protein CKF96_02370 [Priestia filamentosa]
MTLEDRLIQKTYYKHFINDNENRHPIEVLGEAAVAEQEKESYDLSDIRFAQGEVYYHSQDFETAIFKWENINSELEPWAKKNIGDTYYKTGRLSDAEEIYLSLKVDDPILTAEVSLQLFSLYIDQDNIERAYEVIKEAVKVNPAYPGITELARSFMNVKKIGKVQQSLRLVSLFELKIFFGLQRLLNMLKINIQQSSHLIISTKCLSHFIKQIRCTLKSLFLHYGKAIKTKRLI